MPDQPSGPLWYLAQFKPNCHRIAERNLLRQGFGTFLPLVEETRRVRGRFVTRLQPLFSGYLMVSLEKRKGGWGAINSTYGVSRLVTLGPEPTPVPGELVRALMQRCDSDGKLLAPNVDELDDPDTRGLHPGDQVQLIKGPFADFVATVDSLAPDRRVWVLMELMGSQTRVAVPTAHLRAV